MKRRVRQLALLLAAVMLLSVTALAADTVEGEKATITDIYSGATATFDTSNPDIINVTFTSNSLVDGSQYLILMIKGSESAYTITEDSILYIDQTEAANKTISFDVYPSGVNNGPLVAAIVNAKYILGDVTGDGRINARDAMMVARCAAQYEMPDMFISAAADVSGDERITARDAMMIARFAAGLITGF